MSFKTYLIIFAHNIYNIFMLHMSHERIQHIKETNYPKSNNEPYKN